MSGPTPLDCKVYIGDLSASVSRYDLEDLFGQYGRIHNIWVAKNPPGFGFVEFEDHRDAEDAVYYLDGKSMGGRRIRVELSNGRHKRKMARGRGRQFDPGDRCYSCGRRGHYAYDCQRYHRGDMPDYTRNRSRSRSRSRSRRSYSRSHSRSRSADHNRKSRSRSPAPRRSRSRSYSRAGKAASRSPSREKERHSHRRTSSRSRSRSRD